MTSSIVVLTRATQDGTLTVAAVYHTGSCWVEARIDGREISTTLGLGTLQIPRQMPNGKMATHYCGAAHQQFAVYEDEARAIADALEQLRVAVAATPEGLRSTRRDLLADIEFATTADQERRDLAWEREDEMGAMREDAKGRKAAAREALARFDAAHPTAAATWDGAAESIRRAQLQDQINYRGE